jgi:hypothetical protein
MRKWWLEENSKGSSNYILVVEGPDKKNWDTVAEVPGNYNRKTKDYVFPNAELIAAAPVLLDSLKELVREVYSSGCVEYMNEASEYKDAFNETITKAVNAIKKAEGEK